MNMKKLQNNYTTPEQSKRLLELGVPVDSADCCLNSDSVIMLNGKTFQENYNEDLDFARLHLIEYPHYVPCWSVGRLIEILKVCIINKSELEEIFEYLKDCVDTVDTLLQIYKEWKDFMDFSKLEE